MITKKGDYHIVQYFSSFIFSFHNLIDVSCPNIVNKLNWHKSKSVE